MLVLLPLLDNYIKSITISQSTELSLPVCFHFMRSNLTIIRGIPVNLNYNGDNMATTTKQRSNPNNNFEISLHERGHKVRGKHKDLQESYRKQQGL